MLPLEFITEDQVTDILMTEFPDSLNLDESKERLELEIVMAAQEMMEQETDENVKNIYDPYHEDSMVSISPMWIDIALRTYHQTTTNRRRDEFKKRFNKDY